MQVRYRDRVADVRRYIDAVIARVRDGDGKVPREVRAAAIDHPEGELCEKVAANAARVSDEDIALAKQSLTEDEIFEVVVCTAIGQAKRQYDAAMAALEEA